MKRIWAETCRYYSVGNYSFEPAASQTLWFEAAELAIDRRTRRFVGAGRDYLLELIEAIVPWFSLLLTLIKPSEEVAEKLPPSARAR